MTLLQVQVNTIKRRQDKFKELDKVLAPQMVYDDVKYVVDDREIKYFAKVNEALATSQAEYIVFIDDDDAVTSNYVETILPYLRCGLFDYVAYNINCTTDGKPQGCTPFHQVNGTLVPTCKCPVRVSIAKNYTMGDWVASDSHFTAEFEPDINTYAIIKEPLYTWQYSDTDNAAVIHEEQQKEYNNN